MSDIDDLLKEKLDEKNPGRVQRDAFLDAISQMESSGGKNTRHPAVASGIQAGDSAIGQYGLMPNTIQELAKRSGQTVDPNEVAQNPELEKRLANQLAQKVLNKFPNQDMAAYSWNQGHNLTPEQVQARDYENSPYVQKFHKIRQMMGY